jgi:NADPH-dependent ferric siderophore reductase
MTESDTAAASVREAFEQRVILPLVPRTLTVKRIERITPRMARITLAGPDLEGFATLDAEDHVKIFPPAEGAELPVFPTVENDRWVRSPDGPVLVFRDYTVRRFDAEAGELDLDFVLHDHGPGGRWATTAQPGSKVGVFGPRGSLILRKDFDWLLLAADETALPALLRRIEETRPGTRVIAFAEVADAAEEQPVSTSADLELTWLHRNGAEPGSTALLEEAVRATELPAGDGYVWVAGEADSIKPLRRYLRRELGLPKGAFDVDGYWRRGKVNFDHHTVEGEEDE